MFAETHNMASVDGSRSLQGASDELYDAVCGPCQTDKMGKKATHYCKECKEYLCSPCKDYHRKLAVTKNHNILSGNKISASASGSQGSSFVTFCGCNKNQEVAFYCEDHGDVICDPCKKVKHRNCKITDVKSKSANYRPATLNPVLTKVKSLLRKLDSMQKQRQSDSKTVKSLTEECKKEIKQFRATIDAFFNKLELNILQELADIESKQRQDIDQQIDAPTEGLQMLYSDHKMFEDAKNSEIRVEMFATEVRVSKSLLVYEAMLDEIATNVYTPALHFVGNQRLIDLQSEISSLGELTGKDIRSGFRGKVELKHKKKVLLGKKAASQGQVNVKDSDDEYTPWITICTFLASGHAVLCDNSNEKMKLLDKALVLGGSLKLDSEPSGVSATDDKNVIITLPDTKQLRYIQVFPQLRTGRTIQLDRKCHGIEVFGDEIYTTQYDGSGQGEVQVLDLNGNIKRRLHGSLNFDRPDYIIVSTSGKIFVSDGEESTAGITCMTADGNMVYKYMDKALDDPRGMYVDAKDNILVCENGSDSVYVIMANGKKYGTLLTSHDGISYPHSIAYRETDDTLLVGCSGRDNVFIYKLV